MASPEDNFEDIPDTAPDLDEPVETILIEVEDDDDSDDLKPLLPES